MDPRRMESAGMRGPMTGSISKVDAGMMGNGVPPAGGGGLGMEAVISALEQARSALDEVETAAMGQRREKSKLPAEVESPAEELGPDDEQE